MSTAKTKIWLGVFLVGGAVLAVVPFLLLIVYWHPVGTHGLDWATNWNGTFDEVDWLDQQWYWYTTTMGRYTSTAMMSTAHYWYSLTAARCLVLAYHLTLVLVLWWWVRKMFPRLRLTVGALLVLLLLALWMNQLSNPYDTLYRYSGLITYQTGLVGGILLTGLLRDEQWLWATGVAVLTVGTNEIVLVQVLGILGVYGLMHRRPLPPKLLVCLVATALAAAIEVLAPGNWVRAASSATFDREVVTAVGLTFASSVYTWASWLSSTPLIALVLLAAAYLPRYTLRRRLRACLLLGILVWLPCSLFPVIFMSGGDSLPEGIVDLQIIPIALLLICYLVSCRPVYLPSFVQLTLGILVVCQLLLAGLAIDRGRSQVYRTAFDRIVVTANSGVAWKQLLDGTAARYNEQVEAHYQVAATCPRDTCRIKTLDAPETILYDATYDRRARGDSRFGYLVGHPGVVVRYATPPSPN